jgi:hypothetical protein
VDLRCELSQLSEGKDYEDIHKRVLKQWTDFLCYKDYCLLGCGAEESAAYFLRIRFFTLTNPIGYS